MKTKNGTKRLAVDWTEETWVLPIAVVARATPGPRRFALPLAQVPHRCYSLPMFQSPLFSSRGGRGFTLIEMLVVIGILGILAGILLPVLAKAKDNAKKKLASAEMASLISAITAYESEYSRPPASKEVEADAARHGDFTYGTKDTPASGVFNLPELGRYQTNNAVVMNIIMDRDNFPNDDPTTPERLHLRNPRRIVSFTAKPAPSSGGPGLRNDGLLLDPWGNPYIISIDMNDDNLVFDAFYTNNIPGQAVAWSLGKDGRVDGTEARNQGANRDNVVSWK